MAEQTHPVSEPMFSEPTFEEGIPTPDPSGFLTKHPNDNPLYDEVKQGCIQSWGRVLGSIPELVKSTAQDGRTEDDHPPKSRP